VEACPEKFDQFVFGEEFGLLPGVYLFHDAFQLVAACDLPKLNYKGSSHDQFRISGSCPDKRGDFVDLS
jgi:hypothetical protein